MKMHSLKGILPQQAVDTAKVSQRTHTPDVSGENPHPGTGRLYLFRRPLHKAGVGEEIKDNALLLQMPHGRQNSGRVASSAQSAHYL